MKNEFTEVMSQKTDQELKKIISSGQRKYQVTALEAAEAEANKRGVDISKIKTKVKRKTVSNTSKRIDKKGGILRWLRNSFLVSLVDSLFSFIFEIILKIFNL